MHSSSSRSATGQKVCKHATTKCIAIALARQPCWISCLTKKRTWLAASKRVSWALNLPQCISDRWQSPGARYGAFPRPPGRFKWPLQGRGRRTGRMIGGRERGRWRRKERREEEGAENRGRQKTTPKTNPSYSLGAANIKPARVANGLVTPLEWKRLKPATAIDHFAIIWQQSSRRCLLILH